MFLLSLFLEFERTYVENGWADSIIEPDQPEATTSQDACSDAMQGMLPATWEDIRTAFKPNQPFPYFTNAQIVEYFVTRTVSDGLHVAESINKSALNLFCCGYVQNI